MSNFIHTQDIKTVQGRGGWVKKWQHSVHVVVECPLCQCEFCAARFHQSISVFLDNDFYCWHNQFTYQWKTLSTKIMLFFLTGGNDFEFIYLINKYKMRNFIFITLNLLTPQDWYNKILVFMKFRKSLMNSYPKVRCPCNRCWRLGRSGKNRVLKHIEPLEKPSCFRRPWTWKIRENVHLDFRFRFFV